MQSIYRCCYSLTDRDIKNCAGRIIFTMEEQRNPHEGEIAHNLGDLDQYGKTDIVWIPLYVGTLENPGPYPPQPLPCYDEHIALINLLGPCVGGIITGNSSIELSYKHLNWNAGPNVAMMKTLVELSAPLITAAGTRPFYGTIDWDFLHDVYGTRNQPLGSIINQYSGAQIIFTGFTLIPDTVKVPPSCEHFQNHQWNTVNSYDHGDKLRRYLDQHEVWSGVCGQEGIDGGNVSKLLSWGFRAGIAGI